MDLFYWKCEGEGVICEPEWRGLGLHTGRRPIECRVGIGCDLLIALNRFNENTFKYNNIYALKIYLL